MKSSRRAAAGQAWTPPVSAPAAVLLLLACGCAGAAPLMHPAHVLEPNQVTVGAGFSGRLAAAPKGFEQQPEQIAEESAVAPGLAPWVAGRMGLGSGFEAGLTYSGRSFRLDGRRAFDLGLPTLSLGLGASGLLPKRRDDLDIRVGGFGADLPVLIGFRSDADIFSLWLGARGGFELLRGEHALPIEAPAPDLAATGEPENEALEGVHLYGGGLLGFRAGFRHVYAVVEVEAVMHYADLTIGSVETAIEQLAVSPSGALIVRF